MKTKKNKSKLALNKMSIAHLDKVEIHKVKGGLAQIQGGVVIKDCNNSQSCTTRWPPPICNRFAANPDWL